MQALRDLLEYNKTIVVHGVGDFEEEHSFFPFDKYNLKESCHLVEGLYQVRPPCIHGVREQVGWGGERKCDTGLARVF